MPTATEREVELALLRKDVQDLKQVVEAQGKQLESLLEAWNTATGMVKFVKWLAGVAAAAGVLVGFFHNHLFK